MSGMKASLFWRPQRVAAHHPAEYRRCSYETYVTL